MKTGDCITHGVLMAMERVARAFRAYREEPARFGRVYQRKREELDTAIAELLRTTGGKIMTDEDTEGKTLPSGPGLREVQRIQDERQETASVCGDCRHCVDRSSTDGLCSPPLPPHLVLRKGRVGLFYGWSSQCECFKRKDPS